MRQYQRMNVNFEYKLHVNLLSLFIVCVQISPHWTNKSGLCFERKPGTDSRRGTYIISYPHNTFQLILSVQIKLCTHCTSMELFYYLGLFLFAPTPSEHRTSTETLQQTSQSYIFVEQSLCNSFRLVNIIHFSLNSTGIAIVKAYSPIQSQGRCVCFCDYPHPIDRGQGGGGVVFMYETQELLVRVFSTDMWAQITAVT